MSYSDEPPHRTIRQTSLFPAASMSLTGPKPQTLAELDLRPPCWAASPSGRILLPPPEKLATGIDVEKLASTPSVPKYLSF
uniref:Uncharacterized protein n=1 Tax=Triticum urartu TaxID=4572 RepID=A0A8R7Q9N0_TRIUA